MKIFKLLILFSFFFLLFTFSPAKADAAVKTWNPAGCGSTSWNTAGNWSGGLPGTGDIATFDGATSNCNVTVDTTIDVAGINITGSYTGTITQGNGNDISIRGSGYTQNAASSSFVGGDSTSDITFTTAGGDFTLTTGAFTAPGGTIIASDNWTISGGTFTATSGTIQFNPRSDASQTVTGSASMNNLTVMHDVCNGNAAVTVASGTTLTVNGTFIIDQEQCNEIALNGPGAISAKGDLQAIANASDNREYGNLVITINGTGDQAISGSGTYGGAFPSITINKSSGTLNMSGSFEITDDFTYTAGTVNPGTSTVIINSKTDNSSTLTGSVTLYNLTFLHDYCGGTVTDTVASGTTITTTGTLTIDTEQCNEFAVNGPGAISAKGDLQAISNVADSNRVYGNLVITINGTGDQAMSGSGTNRANFPAITINKPSGNLNLSGTFYISDDFTYTNGTVVPGTSTVGFNPRSDSSMTLTGTLTLYNVTFLQDSCIGDATATIASGSIITVKGTLTLYEDQCSNFSIDGPGAIYAEGNVTTLHTSGNTLGGSVAVTLTGGNDQTITQANSQFPTGTFTINKSAGTVTLGSDMSMSGTGQDVVISSGVLKPGSYNLTVNDVLTISGQLNQTTGTVTAGTVSLGSKGVWINNSDGDFVLGSGGVSNSGYLRFDGSGPICGGADTIAITSSAGGSSRNWSGTGTTTLIDVNATDQSAGGTGSNQSNTGVSSLTTGTFPANNGDLLIATVTWDNGGGATASISDSVGTNTWSTAVAKQTDGRHAQSMQTFYAKNITGSTNMTVTVTLSVSSSFVRIIAHSVANIDTTSPLDQTAHIENEAGTAVSVGPVTTTANGEYIFAAATDDSGTNTWSADSPFTERVSISSSGTEMQTQDYVQPSSGSISSTWTLSGTNDALAQMATFKNNGGTPAISGSITAYSSTNTSGNSWIFDNACPSYSNRKVSEVTGGASFTGGTSFTSN